MVRLKEIIFWFHIISTLFLNRIFFSLMVILFSAALIFFWERRSRAPADFEAPFERNWKLVIAIDFSDLLRNLDIR